jgi:hypothetical protein
LTATGLRVISINTNYWYKVCLLCLFARHSIGLNMITAKFLAF